MGCKSYALGTIAEINADQYSPKEGWVRIQYLDTGSVTRGHIETLQVLEPGIEKIPGRARRKVKDGSIVYSMVRPNQEHYALLNHPPTDMLASTGFAVIDAKQDIVLPRYLYYTLTRPNVIAHFQALAEQNASTYPTLAKDDLTQLELIIPSINEQRAISAVLASFDQKIAVNNRINDYLTGLRNALVKERISNALEQGIGTWRVVPLKDVAQIQSGYSYKSTELVTESSIGMLGIKNFNRNGSFRSDGFKPLKPEKAKFAQYVALGEIVVAHTDLTQDADIIGRAIQVIDSGGYDRMIASLDLVKVTSSDSSISNEFLAALLGTEDFHNHCLGYVNGTTVLHLGKKALPEYQLKIPENMAIMSELNDAFKSVAQQQAVLIRENRNLERIRDALLPKLMSGEIDVSKIDLSS